MVLPQEVPVMTLPNATLFPQALLPLYIFEPRYRRMLADSLRSHRMFSVAMQKPGRTRESPCTIAGLGLIRVSVDHRDGTSHLILQGLRRVELAPATRYKPYRVHPIRVLDTPARENNVRVKGLLNKVQRLVEHRISLGSFPNPFSLLEESDEATSTWNKSHPSFSAPEIIEYLNGLTDVEQVADLVTCALLPHAPERQLILETVDVEQRLKYLIRFLTAEIQRTGKGHNDE